MEALGLELGLSAAVRGMVWVVEGCHGLPDPPLCSGDPDSLGSPTVCTVPTSQQDQHSSHTMPGLSCHHDISRLLTLLDFFPSKLHTDTTLSDSL